jgi:hypothetical protein
MSTMCTRCDGTGFLNVEQLPYNQRWVMRMPLAARRGEEG